MEMDTLICGAAVLTMDAELRLLQNACVGIAGGKIAFIGKAPPTQPPKTVIDATGMVLLPGLIDCHTHLADAILRCYHDEKPMLTRLGEDLLPLRERIDAETAKAAATVAAAEALRCGVTSLSCLEDFPSEVAEVVAKAGLKANIAPSVRCFDDEAFDFDHGPEGRLLQDLHERWHGYDGGRIRIEAGICGEYATVPALWEAFGAYAANFGLGVQLRLAQTQAECDRCEDRYGLGPVELLRCHRLLQGRITAAGCAALSDSDLTLLHRLGATAVYLPVSALRQAISPADPLRLIRAGLNVALGSDGAAGSGKTDLFWQMRAASLLQAARDGKPDALPPTALLTMATVCGAKAQGREQSCGQIRPGMDADLILIDFTAPHLTPCHNLLSELVHCVTGQDVAMTMVRGKVLYSGKGFPTLDLPGAVRILTEHGIPTTFAPPEPAAREAKRTVSAHE